MIEGDWRLAPTRLSFELLQYKRFQQRTQHLAIGMQVRRIETKQGAGQTGVAHVQLRGLHQSAQLIVVPRRKSLHEKHPLEQRDVVVNRLPSELKGTSEVGDVDETRGLRCRQA